MTDNYTFAKQSLKWFMVITALLTGIMLLSLLGGCKDVVWAQEIDLSIIAKIESNNNPLAYNNSSGARGLYQITEICLNDYNVDHPDSVISLNELYEPKKAEKIAKWYLGERIPKFLRYFHKPVTVENILWAYNAGIGRVINGYMPQETKNYIKKYAKLAKGDK